MLKEVFLRSLTSGLKKSNDVLAVPPTGRFPALPGRLATLRRLNEWFFIGAFACVQTGPVVYQRSFLAAIVKKRHLDTTSERQLLDVLVAGGRKARLAELRAWRKAGLLPALASHGIGAGRSYYWREPDIQAQAERVHDALKRHGRIDETLITVWLAGFNVPLERVRRAWLNRAKMRDRSRARAQTHARAPSVGGDSLLGLGFATLVSLVDPDPQHKRTMLEILNSASTEGISMASRRHLLGMAMVYGPLLENSSLVAMAAEAELCEARGHLRRLLREPGLQIVDAGSETAGHLFLFVLGLVRAGQSAALEPANDDQEKDRGKEHLPLAALH